LSRRDAILDAGRAAFLAHGVAGAPIERIAAGAGVSVGGLYHHFGGKRGLAAAVYECALASYQQAFLEALDDDVEAGVRAVVDRHIDWCLRERPDEARFLLFHGDAAGDLAARNRVFFRAVLDWWRPRAPRDLPFDLIYALWLGPAQEYCRLALAGRSTTDPGDILADAAWAALKGDST
jgi:AcrR family transcriptional regulator